MNIIISNNKLSGISFNGINQLKKISEQFVSDVIDEARHLESVKANSDTPEITADIISDAAKTIRKYGHKRKKSVVIIVLQVLYLICTSLLGLFGFTDLNSNTMIICYCIVMMFGVILQIIIWMKE